MNFTHVTAMATDLGRGLSLLKEAALWLRSQGVDYWQNWIDPEEKYIAWVRPGFEKGEFRFVLDGETLVGMYRLVYEDRDFWGYQAESAGYIHSFTTTRSLANRGLGRKILDDVSESLVAEGIGILRLDCGPRITGLCRYYESYGFVRVGLTSVHGFEAALYEKSIAPLKP